MNAQAFTAGFLPDVVLSYKANESYSIIHKLESRFPTYDSNSKTGDLIFERLDFQNFLERKIGLFSKAAIGYQFRINNQEVNEHRFIQQFAWTTNFTSFRLGHRFRTDQTISEGASPEYRFRYRAKAQLPLEGIELDPGEYYLSVSDEVLSFFQSSDWGLDNRVVVRLGLYINDKNKVETGLDWRMEGFSTDSTEHSLWLALSWYKTL
jgi:hypothetical protein